jgi:hypothetical protein
VITSLARLTTSRAGAVPHSGEDMAQYSLAQPSGGIACGRQLPVARKGPGLTREQFAARAGISVAGVRAYDGDHPGTGTLRFRRAVRPGDDSHGASFHHWITLGAEISRALDVIRARALGGGPK